jgi:uncharacterized protein
MDDELDALLPELPAIAIDGAKGVGKTATALNHARTVYRLDDPDTLQLVTADSSQLATGVSPILIDEHQRWEPSWDLVRRAVDQDSSPGRFLLTGSAAARHPSTHSGAGRIVGLRMRPMTLSERGLVTPTVSLSGLLNRTPARIEGDCAFGLSDYAHAIVRGGFPGTQQLSDRASRLSLSGYTQLIVHRDVPEAGLGVRNPTLMRAWLRAVAAATGTTTSWESLRDGATPGQGDKPARSTTRPWTDALERIWISDPVEPWLPGLNHLGRLGSTAKHHLADPALACALLGLDEEDLLTGVRPEPTVPRDGVFLGALFESLVALTVRVFAQPVEAGVGHLRRRNGDHEIDFIVTAPGRRRVAIEAKLSALVDDRDVRHLLWLKGELGDDLTDMVVVTTGRHAYRRKDGVAVVPLALLGP